jgi:HAD superfamily hydrolase (TIGR01509 family)
MVAAVVFDLDGVLLDSEELWDETREQLARERGGRWPAGAQRAMMGMSSPEWARYMHVELGVGDEPEAIVAEVVRRLAARYDVRLPLVPRATESVEALAERWPLGLASSSSRPLIERALGRSGLGRHFAATVSSEEVAHGKPAPDVYLEATRRLGVDPAEAVAVEDSEGGIRAAYAAGLRVVAIPNRAYPPAAEALSLASLALEEIGLLTPGVIDAL